MRINLLIACLALSAHAASPVSARAGETVRFGVCLSLTGGMRESGNAHLAGVKLRLAEHNAKAGPGDGRLEMLVRDDQSSAERAAAIVEELASERGVSAIIGPTSSTLAAAMRPNARKYKVVVISPTATHPDIGKNDDWVFRVLFDDAFQGTALARFLRKELGVKRAASLVNRRFAYGKTVLDAFRREFVEEGGSMVAEEWFQLDVGENGDADFTDNLLAVKASRPDVVLLPNYSWEVAAILRQSLDVDLDTIFCGGDTWLNENVMIESGNNLEGGYFVAGRSLAAQTPEMRRFAELYDASNDPGARPNSFLGYDALSLLIEALKYGTSGEAIREGLYRLRDFPLASGTISIDREKGAAKPGYIYKIVRVGDDFAPELVREIRP